MKKHNLQRPRRAIKNRDYLFDLYVNQQLSAEEIGDKLKLTGTAVQQYLKIHKIPIRSASERQQLGSKKRKAAVYQLVPNEPIKDYVSRGYCIRYRNVFCRSLPEFVWLLVYGHKFEHIQKEPFVFHNYTPDFVVNSNKIYEIKCSKRYLSEETLDRYNQLSLLLKEELNLNFELVCMIDLHSAVYHRAKKYIKSQGAVLGKTFTIPDEFDPSLITDG